jgi:putative heme-binding domain-containing protein
VAAIEGTVGAGFFSHNDARLLWQPEQPAAVRIAAVTGLAANPVRLETAAAGAVPMLEEFTEPQQLGAVLSAFLSRKGGSAALADQIKASGKLSPKAAERLRDVLHSRGRDDPALTEALNRAMGVTADTPAYSEQFVKDIVAETQKSGDAARGQKLYREKLVACAACHTINGQGGNLGPDISGIGRGLTPDFIVESVLWPRRAVKEGYLSISVSTKTGDEYSGYAISEDATELKLRDVATNTIQRIPKSAIAKRTNAGTIMPDGLTAGLSRQELCDLIAYLTSLGK